MGYPRSPVPPCLPVTMALISSRTGITLGFTWSFILPPSKESTPVFKGKGLMRASRLLLQLSCLLLTPHKLTPGKCLPSSRPHVPSSTSDHSLWALMRGDAVACFTLLKLVVPPGKLVSWTLILCVKEHGICDLELCYIVTVSNSSTLGFLHCSTTDLWDQIQLLGGGLSSAL